MAHASPSRRVVLRTHPQHDPAATTGAGAADADSAAPQPQPSWPAALASASWTQHASAPAGAGPPQHPVAAALPARPSARINWRPLSGALTGVRAIRLGPVAGTDRAGAQQPLPLVPRSVEQTPVSGSTSWTSRALSQSPTNAA